MTDERSPREVFWDAEAQTNSAFGPHIEDLLTALVEELDRRYED